MGDGLGERLDTLLFLRRALAIRHEDTLRGRRALKKLSKLLKQPKANLSEAGFYDSHRPESLAPEDVEQAEALCRVVMVRRGPGSQLTLGALFSSLALAGAPRSLPFWRECLAYTKKRDQLKRARIEFAITGIALAAFRAGDAAAKEALLQLASSGSTPEIRALAVCALWAIPLTLEKEIPPDARQVLARVAVEDTGLLPRYQARLGLRALNLPHPRDAPKGSLSFKVRLDKGFHCVVELPATATMTDLHDGIQEGFRWDADHLYSFFLDKIVWNKSFEIPGYNPYSGEVEAEGRLHCGNWQLGEVGFVEGARFLYYFDYGDSHRFEVTVSTINKTAESGPWPRISRAGKPPQQYADW